MSSLFFITQIVDVVEFSEKKVSAEWIGLILIPLCVNVAEQLGSISTSMKDKVSPDLSNSSNPFRIHRNRADGRYALPARRSDEPRTW